MGKLNPMFLVFYITGGPPLDAHPRGDRSHRARLLHRGKISRSSEPEQRGAAVVDHAALLPRGSHLQQPRVVVRWGHHEGELVHVRHPGGGDGRRLRRPGRAHRLLRAHSLLRGQGLLRDRSQSPGRRSRHLKRQFGAPDRRLRLLPGLLGRPQLLAAPFRECLQYFEMG